MDRPKEDDRELIQFKELYKSNAPMLIFYAGKYVNAITAEDLVQDVFLKVWQKRTFQSRNWKSFCRIKILRKFRKHAHLLSAFHLSL